MENLRTDCSNREKCLDILIYRFLLRTGGRDIQPPDCEYCNMYTPEESEEENGRAERM